MRFHLLKIPQPSKTASPARDHSSRDCGRHSHANHTRCMYHILFCFGFWCWGLKHTLCIGPSPALTTPCVFTHRPVHDRPPLPFVCPSWATVNMGVHMFLQISAFNFLNIAQSSIFSYLFIILFLKIDKKKFFLRESCYVAQSGFILHLIIYYLFVCLFLGVWCCTCVHMCATVLFGVEPEVNGRMSFLLHSPPHILRQGLSESGAQCFG